MAVPPILRGLLRCCTLLLGELGKHDVEGKIADPCVAGKQVPAPLHVRADVATPLVHDPGTHSMPDA